MFEIYKRPDHTEIIKNIIMNWGSLGLPDVDLTKLECKIATARKLGYNSLITFIMNLNGEPMLVIKCPRYSESSMAAESLKNEAEALKMLEGLPGLKDLVPRLFVFDFISGIPVLITDASKGRNFNELLDKEDDPDKLDGLLTAGIRPAAALAAVKGGSFVAIDDAFIHKYVRKPLASVCEYFPQYLEMIERSCEKVLTSAPKDAGQVHTCLVHNDFNPWNLLSSADGKLTVIDWEDASYDGLPLTDFFNYYIVAHRILYVGENLYAKSRNAEQKAKRTGILVNNYKNNLEQYCLTAGIQPRLADLLFMVFAAGISAFFVAEKRKSISYAESWVSMLLDLDPGNCFEKYLKRYK